MQKYYKVLILAITLSFIWGVWWGLFQVEKSKPQYLKGPEVRLLALAGHFTPQFLEEFQKRHKVQLVVSEKNSEAELLREALSYNSKYDLIQMTSFIAKSFILDNVFTPLDPEQLTHFKNVSIDFKNLDFDIENRYMVALAWGINGYLVNTRTAKLTDESLEQIFSSEAKSSLLASPVEIYYAATKIKPIIKNWLETGQNENLKKDLHELKSRFKNITHDGRSQFRDGNLSIVHISNGQAAKLLASSKDYKFILPKERATLWINLIGISRGAHDIEFAQNVLNQLLSDRMNELFVASNEQASALESLNKSSLSRYQKASFVRDIPLSRVELFINHEALESTWIEAIRNEWPSEVD